MHLPSKLTSEMCQKLGNLDEKQTKTVSKCPLCYLFFKKPLHLLENKKKSISVFRFSINTVGFWKIVGKVSTLRGFCFFFFSFKLPTFWHISEVSFDCKCLKILDILIFIMENQTTFVVFLLNRAVFAKTELKWTFESVFG